MNRPRLTAISLGVALHLALAGVVIWLLIDHSPLGGDTGARTRRSVVAGAADPDLRPRSRSWTGRSPDEIGKYLPSPPPVDLFGFRGDLDKIRSRWDVLFPFVTTQVSFEVETIAERLRASSGLVFTDPRRAPRLVVAPHPPLAMSQADIQRLVDRTWTRRARWNRFGEIAALARRHDADAGRLPAVIRSYVDQNLLQPYEEMSLADPRRWVMLMLAADDRDYVDFVAPYVRAHPRSRTSTELLFLIDALMQGNCNALLLLLETDPRRDLLWTAHENVQAWVFFDALRDYYRDRLRAEGSDTPAAIRRRYDDQRLRLLGTLLRQTPGGYRAGDAHFQIGKIRWSQGDRAAAVREWRLIHTDREDAFAPTYAAIVEALAADAASTPGPITAARIDAALRTEHQRWVAFHDHRLSRFGYAPYMF